MSKIKKEFLEEISKVNNIDLYKFGDYLKDLIDFGISYNLIDGVDYFDFSNPHIKGIKLNLCNPRLTLNGEEYLSSLVTPKVEEPIKIELVGDVIDIFKDLSNNQREIVKIMSQNVKIFEEIAFLEADKTSIMKEELVNLRNSSNEKNIPWDTLINLISLIINSVPKA